MNNYEFAFKPDLNETDKLHITRFYAPNYLQSSTDFQGNPEVPMTHYLAEFLKTQNPNLTITMNEWERSYSNKHPIIDASPFLGNSFANLRGYQQEQVFDLANQGLPLLLNPPRTGKTPISLVAMEAMMKRDKINHLIILAPSSTVLTGWVPETRKWTDLKVHSLFKTNYKKGIYYQSPLSKKERLETYEKFFQPTSTPRALIMSIDTWKLDFLRKQKTNTLEVVPEIKKFITRVPFNVIADETHYMRAYHSYKSCTAKSRSLVELCKYAHQQLLLTGTPMNNHPSDIFGMLHIANPKVYNSYGNFIYWFWGRTKRRGFPELNEYFYNSLAENIYKSILNELSVRVDREEIMQWLPPVDETVVTLEPDFFQAKEMHDTVFYMQNSYKQLQTYLQMTTQLRILSNLAFEPVTHKVHSCKLDYLVQRIKDSEDFENENLLVLSKFTDATLNPFFDELLQVFGTKASGKATKINGLEVKLHLITGATSQDERKNIINDIQTNHKVKHVLLAQTDTIKEGITLSAIDTTIVLDESFTPSDNEQAAQRMMSTTPQEALSQKQKQLIHLCTDFYLNSEEVALLENNPETHKDAERIKGVLTNQKVLYLLEHKQSITNYINQASRAYDEIPGQYDEKINERIY